LADTPEKKVKKRVTALLKEYGAYNFYPMTGGYGRSGIPDIIACHKGKFIGIECKAGEGKTTALQDRELDAIIDAGGWSMVVREDNLHELEGWLKLL